MVINVRREHLDGTRDIVVYHMDVVPRVDEFIDFDEEPAHEPVPAVAVPRTSSWRVTQVSYELGADEPMAVLSVEEEWDWMATARG